MKTAKLKKEVPKVQPKGDQQTLLHDIYTWMYTWQRIVSVDDILHFFLNPVLQKILPRYWEDKPELRGKNAKDIENSYLKSINNSSDSTLRKPITQVQSGSKSLTYLSRKKMFKWKTSVQNVPNAIPSEHLALWQALLSNEPFCLPSVAKEKPQLCDLKSNG